jgi:type II secretory pathway pseudopilin PulG
MLNIATHFRFCRRAWRPGPRRGLTLIELLVVVSIMMLLVVITVPRMRPAMENRRIREAARAINVYLSSARSRAIETGRPCGVAIVRDDNLPLAGSKLIQVEVPEPYQGDTDDTYLSVSWDGTVDSQGFATVIANRVSGSTAPGLIRVGDKVQIGYQGHIYTIVAANSVEPNTKFVRASPAINPYPDGFPLTLHVYLGRDPSGKPMILLPWPVGGSAPQPFQIFRQPVPSAAPPLQLPRGVVIDLWYSGTTSAWFASKAPQFPSIAQPMILFSPNGSVTQVAADTIGIVPAMEPIFLLVGRRDRVNPDPQQGNDVTRAIPAVAEDGRTNLDDLVNLWVAINPQTGYIVCAENSPGTDIRECRRYAREFQAMGGR